MFSFASSRKDRLYTCIFRHCIHMKDNQGLRGRLRDPPLAWVVAEVRHLTSLFVPTLFAAVQYSLLLLHVRSHNRIGRTRWMEESAVPSARSVLGATAPTGSIAHMAFAYATHFVACSTSIKGICSIQPTLRFDKH